MTITTAITALPLPTVSQGNRQVSIERKYDLGSRRYYLVNSVSPGKINLAALAYSRGTLSQSSLKAFTGRGLAPLSQWAQAFAKSARPRPPTPKSDQLGQGHVTPCTRGRLTYDITLMWFRSSHWLAALRRESAGCDAGTGEPFATPGSTPGCPCGVLQTCCSRSLEKPISQMYHQPASRSIHHPSGLRPNITFTCWSLAVEARG